MSGTIPVDVGWRNLSPQAALAFFPPEPLGAAEALEAAPLAHALGAHILQVRAPFSMRLQRSPPHVKSAGFRLFPERGGMSAEAFRGLVSPVAPDSTRYRENPAVQVSLNLQMVTEEVCTLNLTSPFLSPEFRTWPGTLVCGRFPLHAWPRALNAVLEWQDSHDWVVRRGDPLAYLWLHFDDPRKVPNLVEAALTPALKRHFAQIDNVSNFGRNVGPMFEQARARRPARLLTPKRTGCPDFS